MNLVDRYLHVVAKHLPEETREDVSRELRANIEEMLTEDATEEDVRSVLEKLGDPKKLAAEYRQYRRYLIGPELYDSYLSVLKLVITILPVISGAIALLEGILGTSGEGELLEMSIGVFVNVLVAAIGGAFQACAWVTLVFAILERTGVNEGQLPFVKKRWTPDDLMTMEIESKRKISRGETAFSIACTVLFMTIFYFKPQIFGWYQRGDNGVTAVTPIFAIEHLQYYIPVLLIFTIAALIILVWKFISMEWNIPLAAVNTVYNMALCVLVYIMISDASLVNQAFLSNISRLAETPLSQISAAWLKGARAFGIVFIVVSIWDSVSGFIKSMR